MVASTLQHVAPAQTDQPAHRRRLRFYLAFVVCDILVATIALVVLLARDTDHPRRAVAGPRASTSSPTVRLTAAQATMVGWAVDELPRASTLLADRQIASMLRAKGFTVIGPGDAGGRTIQFVVSTATLRAQARQYPAATNVLASSVPVAVARSGRDVASVRQVTAVSSASMASDFRTRQASENQLLANPAFTAAPKAAALLRAGTLDLRAATVLALVAATQRLHLVQVNIDPAESAAGRPARSIDVTAGSTAQLQQATKNLSPDYKLASWEARGDGTIRLTWPVDAQPVPQS